MLEVAQDVPHLLHVLLHLVLARVVGDPLHVGPVDRRRGVLGGLLGLGLLAALLARLLRLLPVGVRVPDLAPAPPAPRADAEAAPLLHPGDVLLGLLHLGVHVVEALLNAVELLCNRVEDENQMNETERGERIPLLYLLGAPARPGSSCRQLGSGETWGEM